MREKNVIIKHLLHTSNSNINLTNNCNGNDNFKSKTNEILNDLNRTNQSNALSTPVSILQKSFAKPVLLRNTINNNSDSNGISDQFCNDKNIKYNTDFTAANNSDKDKANSDDNIYDNMNDKSPSDKLDLNSNYYKDNNTDKSNPSDNPTNFCSSINFEENNITYRNQKMVKPNKLASKMNDDDNSYNDNDYKGSKNIDFNINSTAVVKSKSDTNIASKDNRNENNNIAGSKDEVKGKDGAETNTTQQKKDEKHKSEKKENQTERKAVYIIGDSMIKELKGYELAKSINHKKMVKVRSHPSAQVRCLTDHINPIIRSTDAEHIILHIGTNDLQTEKTPIQICQEIINLASKARDKGIKVSISNIVQRDDYLNEKVLMVNDNLQKICKSVGISIINNGNIRPDTHLNASKLHLNRRGNNILISNIRAFLKSV